MGKKKKNLAKNPSFPDLAIGHVDHDKVTAVKQFLDGHKDDRVGGLPLHFKIPNRSESPSHFIAGSDILPETFNSEDIPMINGKYLNFLSLDEPKPIDGSVPSGTAYPSEVIKKGLDIMGVDRQKIYGNPVTAHKQIAKLWSVIFGQTVSAHQVALAMVALKMVRAINSDDLHEDSYVDIVGYAGIAAAARKEGR